MTSRRLPRRAAKHIAAACFFFFIASGCALGTTEYSECSSTPQCQQAFGFGFVCGSEGLCEQPAVEPRCSETFPADLRQRAEEYADTAIYGSIFDLSVDAHVAREKAMLLAAKQANDAGGLNGRTLGFVLCDIAQSTIYDSLTRKEAAVSVSEYLADQLDLPAIIGPPASDDAVASFQAISASETVMISPSTTSPALFAVDNTSPTDDRPGFLWRTPPSDAFQGRVLSEDAWTRGVREVAIIHETGAYGEELARIFLTRFVDLGGTSSLFPFGTPTQRGEQIAAVAGGNYDEVAFFSSQTADVVAFLNGAAQLSFYDSVSLLFADAAANRDVLPDASSASGLFDQVRGTKPSPLDPQAFVYKNFLSSYSSEYPGEDPSQFAFTAHAYDSAWLLFYASSWSVQHEGELSGLGIARGLRHLSSGSEFAFGGSTWPGAQSALGQDNSVDVRGASGDLDFDPKTEETSGPIDIWYISTPAPYEIQVDRTVSP